MQLCNISLQRSSRFSAVRHRRDHLPQIFDAQVTGAINAVQISLLIHIGDQITFTVSFQTVQQRAAYRNIPGKNKYAEGRVTGLITCTLTSPAIFIHSITQYVPSANFQHGSIIQYCYLLVPFRFIGDRPGTGKIITAHQHCHMPRITGQKNRFFGSSKTTAHNIDITVRKKFPIACRTIGNTTALKRGLAVKSDTARMGTRGKKNSKTLEITPIRMNSLYHTGSFKTGAAINATTPEWWPSQWVLTNYQKLFSGKSAPLWQLAVPFGSKFSANGEPIYFSVGPTAPAAIRWMINTVFMAVMSMILTCLTAAMAGYALAKKRFVGRKLLFTLIVCAMALPKQVILIPLLREMSSLNLYNTIWAVIFPIVGWPFGVFLMKQFSEGIPTEMLEAARIDGASEARTFVKIVLPMVKPGIGALAIFTFINSWNDYFMQLIMLSSTSNLTISLGIAKLQAENSTDFGLIMAGAALAAVPIIIIFLIFQKYFTKGIAMGAVKG